MRDVCIFCLSDPCRCDGRQGRVEAESNALDDQNPLYGRMGDVGYERTSDTSAAAGASWTRTTVHAVEDRIYAAIKKRPRTCDEIEIITGISHQTASSRIRALVLRGRVVDSGLRARTRSGRWATIWERKAG